MKFKILIAEPEEMFAAAVAYVLEQAGHEAVMAHDSRYALDKAQVVQPDLCILSTALPALSRAHLCCDLVHEEAVGPNGSLFLLGTDAREEFCAAMLDCGADGYLVKPFGMREFMARVGVLLRRSHSARPIENSQTRELRVGQFVLNAAERTLSIGDFPTAREVQVTQLELQLLQLLMGSAGQLVLHQTLLQPAEGEPPRNAAALRQLMVTLRRKIGDTGNTPRHIIALHGQGFRFDP